MPRSQNTLLAKVRALAALGAAALLACDDLPRDPDETTDRVAGAVLRVGWVDGAEPTGIERTAVSGLAERLGAVVEDERGPVHRLMADLEDGKLHIVGGELPEKTPFAERVGLTSPVGTVVLRGETQPTVMAIRSGENRFLLLLDDAIARAKR